MKKKILALCLLGIPFLMPSCSEKEENFNEFQTTETNQINEDNPNAKAEYEYYGHFIGVTVYPDGSFVVVEFEVYYYENTVTGELIFFARNATINGNIANLRIYNPNEEGNPNKDKYTVVNLDNNEVMGVYSLEEFKGKIVNE